MGRVGGPKRFGKPQNRQTHRIPIMPYRSAPRGICRMCGSSVTGRRQTWCSELCILNWQIASHTKTRRLEVWKRDRGVCAKCGHRKQKWEVDHIKPLIECSRNNINAFLMENLRTLCTECHKHETIHLNRKRCREKLTAKRDTQRLLGNRKLVKTKPIKIYRKKERRSTKELLRQMSFNPSSTRLSGKIDVKKIRRRF